MHAITDPAPLPERRDAVRYQHTDDGRTIRHRTLFELRGGRQLATSETLCGEYWPMNRLGGASGLSGWHDPGDPCPLMPWTPCRDCEREARM